jgi:hypothetical protein
MLEELERKEDKSVATSAQGRITLNITNRDSFCGPSDAILFSLL